ncbi:MAG: hypothetical protein ABW321_06755 [Polyangiales bacterium]
MSARFLRPLVLVLAFGGCNAILDNPKLKPEEPSPQVIGGTGGLGGRGGRGGPTGGTPPSGGSAASGGEGGSAGEAGAGGEAGAAGGGGEAGAAPVTCEPACSGETPVCDGDQCVACRSGALDCLGDTPRSCEAGQWIAHDACSGDTPLCAAGQCSRFSLTGGLTSLVAPSVTDGPLRLVEHHFEQLPPSCAGELCVTGRIGP